MVEMMNNVIIFDTETTGLLKPSASGIDKQPYIIDICLCKLERDGDSVRVIDTYETLIKPPDLISDEITRITGIKNYDLENAPTFSEVYKDISKFFVGTTDLVAHNIGFDVSMLANELVRIGKVIKFPWPINHICTVEKTKYMEQRRLNLTRLHELLFGCGFDDAHRAKTDVMALKRCYIELVKMGVL